MSRSSGRQLIFVLLFLALLYLVLAGSFYWGVAARAPGANDYYSRWMGARLFFLNGVDPYSDAATRQIQIGMYGRLAYPDEDQVAFAYPFYAAFFTLPLIRLPYAWAESFWIALLIMLVGGAALALVYTFRWRVSPLGLVGVLAFALAFYPALRGIFLGQYTLLVFASVAFAVVLLRSGHEGWAGVVLAVSSVKPHVAVLVLAVILGWGLWQRCWRLLRGFLLAEGLLGLAATALLPTWPLEFVSAVGRYQDYIHIGPPVQVLSELVLPTSWSNAATLFCIVLLAAALLYRLVRTLSLNWDDFLPTVELAMLVTTLAMLRTATTDQTLLLIPWLHWLSDWVRGRQARRAALVALAVVVTPWVLFLVTLQGRQEAPIATTGPVVLTLITYLIVYRHDWFPVRRTPAQETLAA